jgi:hypothetical protein
MEVGIGKRDEFWFFYLMLGFPPKLLLNIGFENGLPKLLLVLPWRGSGLAPKTEF